MTDMKNVKIDLEGSVYTQLSFKRAEDKQNILRSLEKIIPDILGVVNEKSLPYGKISFYPYIEDGKLTFHLAQYGSSGCDCGVCDWDKADQVVKTPFNVTKVEHEIFTDETGYWGGNIAILTEYIVG